MSYDLTRIPDIAASLEPIQKECAVTLALKIVDDSCKMDDYERSVFMEIYDAMPKFRSELFEDSVFTIIAEGRVQSTAKLFAQIKALREAGMEYVTRPGMKAYKAAIRDRLSS